jgi:hypothetical protein
MPDHHAHYSISPIVANISTYIVNILLGYFKKNLIKTGALLQTKNPDLFCISSVIPLRRTSEGPQHPEACHLYLAEECHFYIAPTANVFHG